MYYIHGALTKRMENVSFPCDATHVEKKRNTDLLSLGRKKTTASNLFSPPFNFLGQQKRGGLVFCYFEMEGHVLCLTTWKCFDAFRSVFSHD